MATKDEKFENRIIDEIVELFMNTRWCSLCSMSPEVVSLEGQLKEVLQKILSRDPEYEDHLLGKDRLSGIRIFELPAKDYAVTIPIGKHPTDRCPEYIIMILESHVEKLSPQAVKGLIAHEFGEVEADSLYELGSKIGDRSVDLKFLHDKANEIACGWGFEEELKQLDMEKEKLKCRKDPWST